MNIKGCQITEMQTPDKSTQLNFSALTDNSNSHNLSNKLILVIRALLCPSWVCITAQHTKLGPETFVGSMSYIHDWLNKARGEGIAVKLIALSEGLTVSVKEKHCTPLTIMHGSVLSQCTDVQEILATVSTGHVTCSVSQFVFAECISSTEFHIALLTLKLVSTSVKVDVFFEITWLFEGLLTNVTLEWSFT